MGELGVPGDMVEDGAGVIGSGVAGDMVEPGVAGVVPGVIPVVGSGLAAVMPGAASAMGVDNMAVRCFGEAFR